jgi:hypothetical protein
MDISVALYSYLSNYAGLTALVSTRIYPTIAPQGATIPCVVIQKISGNRNHTMQGDIPLTNQIHQISIYAESHASQVAIAAQIRVALNNYVGVMATNGVTVQGVMIVSEFEGYDTEAKEFFEKIDFEIFYDQQ